MGVWEISTTFLLNKGGGLCRTGGGSRGGNKGSACLEEKACSPTKAQFVQEDSAGQTG